ncbi:MAG: hypothetical protein ACYSQZ_08205 [Planctomycetota bacterium]|jgi:hypothetical protein
MSKLSISKPKKFEDAEKWIVYIIGEDGLLTGVAGMGNTPQEAQRNALKKIEKGEGEIKD